MIHIFHYILAEKAKKSKQEMLFYCEDSYKKAAIWENLANFRDAYLEMEVEEKLHVEMEVEDAFVRKDYSRKKNSDDWRSWFSKGAADTKMRSWLNSIIFDSLFLEYYVSIYILILWFCFRLLANQESWLELILVIFQSYLRGLLLVREGIEFYHKISVETKLYQERVSPLVFSIGTKRHGRIWLKERK